MRVIRNTGQNVSPSDDGRLYDKAFTDGLFNSPSITSLGANLVQIGSMYGILCGRDFTADAQQINVELPTADTATGYIYIKYNTATDVIISVESALAPFTVTYEDINTSGTVCEMIIATYTASSVAVTSLTASYPTAQTEVNKTLAGSLATIETSPATANHAVGEYIVYNGQLYKVTTAIIAGQSLAVGANIVAVSVADNFTWQPITVDMTKLFACDIRTNGNLISISITTQNLTFRESDVITVLPENARPIAEHKFALWNYTSDKVYMATIYPDGEIVCYGKGSITGRLVGSIMIPKA